MLVQLAIRDIVLIDRLDIAFDRGLSVLTGETGAGKSILLDAFALALGGRGDGSLVRHGEAQGQVTALFDLDAAHPAWKIAQGHDIPVGQDVTGQDVTGQDVTGQDIPGDLILRRVQMADGRTRAFVNDQPVSVQVLRAIGAALVEIHGQHDDRALVDPASHRAILDAFGGHGALVEAVAAAHARLAAARAALASHAARVENGRKEADYLRHSVAELTTLAPEPGEEAALAAKRQDMMQAEKVAGELNEAFEAVAGHASPVPALSAAVRRLERRATQAPLLVEPGVKALDAALVALDEARAVLEAAIAGADFDRRELEQAEERLFALRAASRKFNVAADNLAALRERFAAELAALDDGERELAARAEAMQAADAAYVAAAVALASRRRQAAAALDKAVGRELPPLKLERARFLTHIEADETSRGPDGFERVEFWVETNPGTRPGPLMKVASGGELARFMLALKVVLADKGSAPTLVFDEIDTGAGGAVADAIGSRLERLARRVQVMAVTHAPQVAARAASHFLIAKEDVRTQEVAKADLTKADLANGEPGKQAAKGDAARKAAAKAGRVATRVKPLAADARREEIARMLAGATITEEARAAAARLLEAAR